MHKDSKIYIAGHRGLVGSAILKKLQNEGYKNLVLRTHQELDLTRQREVEEFFQKEKPEVVFFCAAKVGGMIAQLEQRGNFLYENLMMQNNVIHNAYISGCRNLLYIASLCIYPEQTQLPIKEEYLFKGDLQYNNEPYGIAKIAGMKLCEFYSLQYHLDYLSIAPVSVYGANDRFDFISSHVQAAIFRKIYLAKLLNEQKYELLLKDMKLQDLNEAKSYLNKHNIDEKGVILLGTGNASREFLHCDDLAEAAVFFMKNTKFTDCLEQANGKPRNSHINIGTGELISIKELAFLIQEIINYKGEISFENKSENDGTIKKIADYSKARSLGWDGAKIPIKEGLKQMYQAYLKKLQMV
nr:GDP-L-fucose synthase [uncultured Helicobacter sp.]